jgi:hypothetical protein
MRLEVGVWTNNLINQPYPIRQSNPLSREGNSTAPSLSLSLCRIKIKNFSNFQLTPEVKDKNNFCLVKKKKRQKVEMRM